MAFLCATYHRRAEFHAGLRVGPYELRPIELAVACANPRARGPSVWSAGRPGYNLERFFPPPPAQSPRQYFSAAHAFVLEQFASFFAALQPKAS